MMEKNWQELNNQITVCRKCPRLVAWREEIARKKKRAYLDWQYWGKPVPGFGDHQGRILVVGLAPGAHGSNRTGRMFTGDSSGNFLFPALFRAGFANRPIATKNNDGLKLVDLFITAICRCVPPKNRPNIGEIKNCLPYLEMEIALMKQLQIIVALGGMAFDDVKRLFRKQDSNVKKMKFSHGAIYSLGDENPLLFASYHPSRQNTQTGRLTKLMFDEIWREVGDMREHSRFQ